MPRARRTAQPQPTGTGETRAGRWRVRAALLGLSLAWCAILAVCYGVEADTCAALTLWPAWAWALPGIALALATLSRRSLRAALLTLLAWIVCLCALCEEARYPVRALREWPAPRLAQMRESGRAVRIITINCCVGQPEAVTCAKDWDPDVVLLQEAPGEREVAQLARALFGAEANWVQAGDNAVLARGQCEMGPVSRRQVHPYAWGHVRLKSGAEFEAVSVHLLPPALRLNLWSPYCWRTAADLDRGRRLQLQGLMENLQQAAPGVPILVGGDMNLPASDGVLRVLKPRLRDSFRVRGVGWGDTVLNELPISRFDQVWVGEGLTPLGTRAVRSPVSDHRMVICDLAVGTR
jgi:endonuclease/exonuclease/phosphatase (EEP) superfamily protein YafD